MSESRTLTPPSHPFAWTWSRVLEALGNPSVHGAPSPLAGNTPVRAISTDTRSLGPGDLFVALEGPRYDGHAFLAQAQSLGARAAVVHRLPADAPASLPLILIDDTLAALGALARHRRDDLRLRGVKVVGITGSVGKTTTRALIQAALASHLQVHATRANENNQIGLPLTLLATPDDAEVVILEIGTNQPGEIAALTHIAHPDIVLLTTVSEAHTEGLGSLEGVFVEKLSILSGFPAPEGVVVGDAPAELADRAQRVLDARGVTLAGGLVVTGFSDGADPSWRARPLEMDAEGFWHVQIPGGTFRSPVPGMHGAHNALMALAVADLLGVRLGDAIEGLARVEIPGHRSQLRRLPGGLLLVDCYNANPQSTAAALAWLASLPVKGPRLAILGSMGELGEGSAAHHEAILKKARALGLDGVVALGAFAEAAEAGRAGAEGTQVISVDSLEGVPAAIASLVRPGTAILIKGSRSAGLEAVLPFLEGLLTQHHGEV